MSEDPEIRQDSAQSGAERSSEPASGRAEVAGGQAETERGLVRTERRQAETERGPAETERRQAETERRRFNPFVNEDDMFKVVLWAGGIVLAIILLVVLVRGVI